MLRFLGMPVLPALSAVISVCLYGCSSPVGSYQSHDIKSGSLQMDRLSVQAAQYHGPLRNPVIVIHGFLGSRLLEKESGMEIWGTFSNRLPSSYVLARLAHPMKYGIPLKNISDGTQAFSLMDIVRIRVMGFPFSMHGYKNLVDMLENYGYLPEKSEYQESDPPPSLFIFFYDWRRDAVENAARLSRFIEEKHQFLCRKYQLCH